MSFNLLDSVKKLFSNDIVSSIAASTGESENSIHKAISGAIPAALLALLNKTSTGNAIDVTSILNISKQTANSSILSNLSQLTGSGDSGIFRSAINSLFGDKINGIAKTISAYAGIKESSASSVLNVAAPATLATLGSHAGATNMSASNLLSFLTTQKNSIVNGIPAGLNLVGPLGFGNIEDIRNKVSGALPGAGENSKKTLSNVSGYADGTIRNATKGRSRLGWLLLIVFAAIVISWLALGKKSGCSSKLTTADSTTKVQEHDTVKIDQNTSSIIPTAKGVLDSLGNFIYDPGTTMTIGLPHDGGKIEVGENSTEAKIVSFLKDRNAVIDTVKGNWFELTNVRFKTSSSNVTDESLVQLQNIVKIARAFPSAQFKLGGYTDNTGDSAKNVSLSQKRADAVVVLLKKLGVPALSLSGAKGYGPQWPIGDNATAEGRAMNRRVALKVKKK